MIADRRAAIEARAYAIWEKEGRPHEKALEHWLRAETEVDAEEALRDASSAQRRRTASKPRHREPARVR